MLSISRFFWLIPLAVAAPASAQTPAAPTEARAPVPEDPRVERIRHEDGLSRIDELRVGGQTRSIEVSPKNGAPAYQVAPVPASTGPAQGANNASSAGKSSWRILSF